MNIADWIALIEAIDHKHQPKTYYVGKQLAEYIKEELGYVPSYIKIIGEDDIE